MGIISYAQNFEDVLLWRALGHVERGCYIDIGAHDPIVDSVSKAFYEHGWRGIHVEPLPVYCDALRRDRPDETVLQAAVAAETGVLRFFEIPDTGISTGDEAIAQSHRERGFQINEITVPSVTLAQVFQLVKGDVVHWLKIDVEGLEEQVLRGWGESSLRPWIVVVESTLPLTQDEVFSTWEGLLVEKGYRCVHFDGLNRYYLAKEQSALKNAFRSGPNVFDGFQFNGTANNPFCGHVAQSIRNELGDQIESLKQQALLHKTDEPRLAEELEHSEKLKQALQAEQAANLQNQNAAKALALQFERLARRETEAQLRTAMQREQEFTAQLLAAKDQLQQLEQARSAREKQLQEQLAQAEQQSRQEIEAQLRTATQREQEFTAQLLTAKDQLQQLEQARGVREQQLQEQLAQAEQQSRQEIEAQLRTATQREQEFTVQLLAAKDQLQQLEQARGVREQQLQEQLAQAEQQSRQEIEAQLRTATQREQEFTAQLLAAKDQLQQLEQARSAREQQLQEQLAQAEQQSRQEIEAQLRTATQREQEFTAQLLAAKDQLQQLEQARSAREKQLQEQLAQAEQQSRQEIEAQLRTATQREQEFTAQLLAGKEQLQQLESEHHSRQRSLLEQLAETERQSRLESEAHFRNTLEREQAVAEQLLALQQQAAQALAQQASELQSQYDELRLAWEIQEKTLHQEISNLADEVQALRHANELQTQKHGFVMDAHLAEHQRLIEAYAALESRLKVEIEAEQQTNMRLRQALAEVQQVLAETYASFTWRLTAPLRAVFFLFAPKRPAGPTVSAGGNIAAPAVASPPASHSSSVTIPSLTPEPIMLSTSVTYQNMPVAAASTLDELLAYHDQSFVVCAYHTLLGRAPDPEGLGYYLGRLRTGVSKIQLLAQLRLSKEGKAHAAELPGLEAAIQRHQRGQYPLIGGLFRRLNGGEGNHPTERKLRGIENQLIFLSNESNRRFDQLDTALACLHHVVVQQTQSVVAALGAGFVDTPKAVSAETPEAVSVETPDAANIIPNRPLMGNQPKQLSPRARDIYFQLKAAIGHVEGAA